MNDSVTETARRFPMSEVVTFCGTTVARRNVDAIIDVYEHVLGVRLERIDFFLNSPEGARQIVERQKAVLPVLRERVPDLARILDEAVPAAVADWDRLAGEERKARVLEFADALDARFGHVPLPRLL